MRAMMAGLLALTCGLGMSGAQERLKDTFTPLDVGTKKTSLRGALITLQHQAAYRVVAGKLFREKLEKATLEAIKKDWGQQEPTIMIDLFERRPGGGEAIVVRMFDNRPERKNAPKTELDKVYDRYLSGVPDGPGRFKSPTFTPDKFPQLEKDLLGALEREYGEKK